MPEIPVDPALGKYKCHRATVENQKKITSNYKVE
jgi:hypothetical protein